MCPFFCVTIPRPPGSTPFPYTTLFRSGAGMGMTVMCDVRVAAESARFSTGYVKVGLVPGDGDTYFLPRLIGAAKDRKSTRLNSSHLVISYAVFCLKKKTHNIVITNVVV